MTKSVRLDTSAGPIHIELDEVKAPLSTQNFLDYVRKGHYDGTVFHRVIKGFMVQGGGMDKTMKQKDTAAAIQNEAKNGLKNQRYTVAMARTSDPHSATAQFFVNTTNNSFLDNDRAQDGWGYAVFGKVVAGTEVIDAIEKVRTGRKGFHDDVPLEDVSIVKATEIA